MDYNNFRLTGGRFFSVFLAFFVPFQKNYFGLPVLLLGVFIRIWASGYIHKNKEVTISGPYRYIRHPLYTGSFFIALGTIIFFRLWIIAIIYIVLFFIVYRRKAKLEEMFLIKKFGDQYLEYMKNTPAFFPQLGKKGLNKDFVKFKWSNVVLNKEVYNFIGLVLIMIILIYLGHITYLAKEKMFIYVVEDFIEAHVPAYQYVENFFLSFIK